MYYDLVHFELGPEKISYLGYTRYENLKGSKRKIRKWKKRRRIAYNGSSVHFMQSVQNQRVKSEGFIVDEYVRILNPERPSDSIIQLARKRLRNLAKAQGGISFTIASNRNLNSKDVRDEVLKKATENKQIQTHIDLQKAANQNFAVSKSEDGLYKARTQSSINKERDSLMSIIRKARLKKYVDKLVKKDLKLSEYSKKINQAHLLSFPNYLKIRYMNEPEEDNFRPGNAKLQHQESMISLFVDRVEILPSGILVNPLDMFMEGYWSYERIADSLPLDYVPED